MERSKTWFTACLTLLGLAVLSFSTCSDVNALMYGYDNLPLLPNYYIAGDVSNTTNSLEYHSGSFLVEADGLPSDWAVPSGYEATFYEYSSSTGECSENHGPLLYAGSSGVLSGEALAGNFRYFNISETPVSDSVFCHNRLEPSLSAFYIGKYSSTGGFNHNNFVSFNHLMQDVPSDLTFTSFNFPLNIHQDSYFGDFPEGTKLTFIVKLASTSEFELLNTPHLSLSVQYFALPYNHSLNLTDQQLFDYYNEITVDRGLYSTGESFTTEDGQTYYEFRCEISVTLPSDASFISPTLEIYDGDGLFTKSPSELYFGPIYLVTNDDYTWSGMLANEQLWGYDAPPLSPQQGCSNGDFFCQLGNLFDFNLINPFTPLFAMFADNSTCANIPTIAGMIHSEETTVCPWFNSSTRNIVTPVLGIASVMLLFGFAVRWLGARSGNFFEDSTDGFDSGGIHVGRRKKK